jgi:hypothetical protein
MAIGCAFGSFSFLTPGRWDSVTPLFTNNKILVKLVVH